MTAKHHIIFGIVFGIVLCLTNLAAGQCPEHWLPGDGMPGLDGEVRAATTWDPDGAGPQPELLVVGGNFTTAGGLPASYIAAWDGSSWLPLGSGMNGIVLALAVYNGELVAAGDFTTAGGVAANRIARWDGSSWLPLGSGMNSSVRALTVYNGELIAGGRFTTAGGTAANRIARWDGSSWLPLGSGMNYLVFALTVYNGELIAGGWFTTAGGVAANYIAHWDGSSWQALGSGMNYWVEALTVYNGELVAGGRFFTTAGGNVSAYWARWGVFEPDLSCDDWVNFEDFTILAGRWPDVGCDVPDWCDGADLNRNHIVDSNDVDILTDHWLQGP